jgi:Predicted membrane protein (DUF2142)
MVGFVLLGAAWVVGTQPFGGPDESSHYLRALSIVNGKLIGPKAAYPAGLNLQAQAFINHDTTAVLVPAPLSPYAVACGTGQPDLTECYEPDPNGNFPPLPYLLPAVAISGQQLATPALWRARVAAVVPALAFLMLAVALLWAGTAWSLLGLLGATTPMVLYASSVLNPSGLQTTSALAFAAAGLRIARAPTLARRWVWVAFALSGGVAMLSGPIGLEFAVFELVVCALVLGQRGLADVFLKTDGRVLLGSGATLLGAAALSLIYTRVAGFSATIRFTPFLSALRQGVEQLPGVLRDAVGTFGALNVPLPNAAHWIWWLFVLGLIAAAMWLGSRRERRVVATVTLLGLAFPVLFYAWVDRNTGFGLQGREVLPVLMVIPLVAGEVVYRHRDRIASPAVARAALAGAIVFVAAFQAYAWWYDAAHVTNAPGSIDFFRHVDWIAPLGWQFWIAVAALGTAALLAFATTEEGSVTAFAHSPARIRRSPS